MGVRAPLPTRRSLQRTTSALGKPNVRLDPGNLHLEKPDVRLDLGDFPLEQANVRLDLRNFPLEKPNVRLDLVNFPLEESKICLANRDLRFDLDTAILNKAQPVPFEAAILVFEAKF
jgi:hypothetical protein